MRTKHQIVQKVAVAKIATRHARNKTLKQAASQGKTRVKIPNPAQEGYAPVPASVATLTPGLGPPMSSTPGSGVRGVSASSSKVNRTEVYPRGKALQQTDVYKLALMGGGSGNTPFSVKKFYK